MTDEEARVAMWLEWSETWWKTTANPLHVWRAIALCLNADPPQPIPGWCLPYLASAADNLNTLKGGQDFRDRNVTVSPDEALALTPRALGLSRQGKKNAFRQIVEHSRDDRHRLDAEFHSNPEAVAQAVSKERNISIEAAQRRIAKSKKLSRQG